LARSLAGAIAHRKPASENANPRSSLLSQTARNTQSSGRGFGRACGQSYKPSWSGHDENGHQPKLYPGRSSDVV
jgi:hypothetical protein